MNNKNNPNPETLADQLAAMITELQRYIDDRAAEIAAPRISTIETEASNRLQAIQTEWADEQKRQQDLETELRIQLMTAHFRLDELAEKHGERRDSQIAAMRSRHRTPREAATSTFTN